MIQILSSLLLIMVGAQLSSSWMLSEATEFYVTALPNQACPPGKPCYTLEEYTNKTKNKSLVLSGKDEVSLLFLDGQYEVTNLQLTDIRNLTIAGVGDSFGVEINLNSFKTQNVSILEFHNINITSLGDVIGYLRITGIDHLIFDELIIKNVQSFLSQTGDPLYISIQGCKMINSFFQFGIYQYDGYLNVEGNIHDMYIKGGAGLAIIANGGHLTVSDSSIANTSIGLAILQKSFSDREYNNPYLSIDLHNCDFYENRNGITVETDLKSSVKIRNCTFSGNARGVYILGSEDNLHLLLDNTLFTTNTEFGVFISINSLLAENNTIILRSVRFIDNHVSSTVTGPLNVNGHASLTLQECTFKNNTGRSTMILHRVDLLFLGRTIFSDNVGRMGGALHLITSTMMLDRSTSVTFQNNRAESVGGAIYIDEVEEQNIFDIQFTTNVNTNQPSCFYQLTYNIMQELNNEQNTTIIFDNNYAENGGNNIYGASLKDSCLVTPDKQNESYQIQDKLFQFETTSLSSVSSNPKRVCLCEGGEPQCANTDYIYRKITTTSGEKFTLSLVLVGNDFGTHTGAVYAEKLDNGQHFEFGEKENLQRITQHDKCFDLEYSVHSRDQNAVFILTLSSTTTLLQDNLLNTIGMSKISRDAIQYNKLNLISSSLLNVPVIINVTIAPCPLGFTDKNHTRCQCVQDLNKYIQNCTVANQISKVNRVGTSWVGIHTDENSGKNTIEVYEKCPFDYCTTVKIGIELNQSDIQCAFNRTGILCGACSPGHSIPLGSSRCIPCSDNWYITLLLVFILAGIFLVLFVKICNLTVATGTINGFIFYVNILWINQNIFFPNSDQLENQDQLNFFYNYILKVFVAWLNLDLGIEVCFYDGLDAYGKVWLQFLFPFYIWIITGLIILFCHYSTRATKIFGNNTVSVLATLILFSYVKLLRNILSILKYSPGLIYYSGGKERMEAWSKDGTVNYLEEKHIPLFVAGLLVLILLYIPYTVILLLVPYFEKYAYKPYLNWINKLKPLFDSYYGPLKDKHRYWIGVTLLARVILALVSVFTSPTNSLIAVACLSALFCIPVTHVYKKLYNVLLEASFLFNLIVLSIACIATPPGVGNIQTIIKYICGSVFISFVTFVGILIINIMRFFIKKYCRNVRICKLNSQTLRRVDQPTQTVIGINGFVNVTKTSVELRESLLDSDF